ncbi:MAG TPA: hypothetical protein VN085_06025 [Vicinamibacterales bacterium]|nr:hypothetical protein [Vicinamibacterales bacterium]
MTNPISRPAIGARVRFRRTTGIQLGGLPGKVIGYHEDGVAIVVELDDAPKYTIVCDPVDVTPEGDA